MIRFRAFIIACFLLGVALETQAATPLFNVVDLGPHSGQWVRLNDRGQVAFTRNGQIVRHTDGLGIEMILPDARGIAFDINNQGQVLGRVTRSDGEYITRYTDGIGAQDLVKTEGFSTYPLVMNDHGDFAGISDGKAYIYTDAGGQSFLPLASAESVRGLNNAGQVVGNYSLAPGYQAFRFDPVTGLETLPFERATAINDAGQIVVSSLDSGYYHASRLETDGSLTGDVNHGTRGGPFDINAAGDYVGATHFQPGPPTGYHAFRFTDEAGFQYLGDLIDPSLGWELWRATGINTFGQIAGVGRRDGELHAFRLDPVQPIPEPGSLVLLGVGGLGLLRARFRRQAS